MLALILSVQMLLQTGLTAPTASEWMDPQAMGLCIGMDRVDVEDSIARGGLKATPGKYPRQLIVHYGETKSVMLQFVDDRLQSIRFELVDFIPLVRAAFAQRVTAIEKELGYEAAKQKGDREVLLYNKKDPNVMVVLSTLPNDDFGRQGLGFLAIRWFDPSAEKIIE